MPSASDHRRYAPATMRNRDPILAILKRILPPSGLVLEVASGTGEHVIHFAAALPGLRWQPSDPDPAARASATAWIAASGLANIREPLPLDAIEPSWPLDGADAMLCINMAHISPWAATEGVICAASRLLPGRAPLYLYGPWRRAGHPTAPSNEAFDADLRARNPAWGLRDLDEAAATAATYGLMLDEVVEMPANNLSVIFRRG